MSANKFKVSEYTDKLIAETEELITNQIPDKIFSLDKANTESFLPYKDIVSITTDVDICPESLAGALSSIQELRNSNDHVPNTKKRKLENNEDGFSNFAGVPCNKKLTHLIDLIKPEVRDVIQTCEKIQMWIQLLIPRIEDGNNFGVSIQEEVLNEVHRIQSESVNYLDSISRYFVTRAKIASKVAKYPFLDDYKRAIKEIDEKEYLSLQFSINEMKSHYLLILDVVSKNYEKIKKPRSSANLTSMY
ncbi:proteasome activator complex subunit 3-like isoform X2 [Hydractinia symbiolongicarpus]|uniref:proteasome activator complex subunit 3-like isoform X2 n=1 Tax=Hydractinia symbiolongicarpus TaxID=13093 RepID=UPI00254C7623|nr:proteasome activator complex subunit 3-like isoform X2 [Hydractinia symbiolongicarpus]